MGEGGRHDAAARPVGASLACGVPAETVEEQEIAWAARCDPPFPAQEILRIVRDLAAKQAARGGESTGKATPAPDWESPLPLDEISQAAIHQVLRNRPAIGNEFDPSTLHCRVGSFFNDGVIRRQRPVTPPSQFLHVSNQQTWMRAFNLISGRLRVRQACGLCEQKERGQDGKPDSTKSFASSEYGE